MQTERHYRTGFLADFYDLLDDVADAHGGRRDLHSLASMGYWPRRGVYFFFEPGEVRSDTGRGYRVVRVGTHALKSGSKSTLAGRLAQHRGTIKSGGGNHRGSIFRLLVGASLMARDPRLSVSSWGQGANAPRTIRDGENELETAVSDYMRTLEVAVLDVPDDPGSESLRGFVERNSIALLSNYSGASIDPPSAGWLGHHCPRAAVRKSGLWNQNHVTETFDPEFLTVMEKLVNKRL